MAAEQEPSPGQAHLPELHVRLRSELSRIDGLAGAAPCALAVSIFAAGQGAGPCAGQDLFRNDQEAVSVESDTASGSLPNSRDDRI
ncbi:hypothetical protein GCM10010103_07150 [Streptomyces paradoxus]